MARPQESPRGVPLLVIYVRDFEDGLSIRNASQFADDEREDEGALTTLATRHCGGWPEREMQARLLSGSWSVGLDNCEVMHLGMRNSKNMHTDSPRSLNDEKGKKYVEFIFTRALLGTLKPPCLI